MHLLRIHLVFREVFHIHGAEVAEPDVQCYHGRFDAFDFEAFHEVFAEVQTRRRGGYRPLFGGEYRLIALFVNRLHLVAYPFGEGCFAEFVECGPELLIGAVEQEAERASARGGVVYHFGHQQVVVAEVEFVAYAYLPCRVHEYVPQAQVAVQFSQQEDFYFRACLLLVPVEPCGENLRVVEDEDVLFVEVVDDLLEDAVLYLACFAFYHHKPRFVAVVGRIFRQQFRRKVVIVL